METTTATTNPTPAWFAAAVALAVVAAIVAIAVLSGSPDATAEQAYMSRSWGVPSYGGW